ncbi:hypothetical protein DJ71_18045, partial [Halorubrum sp. E3]
GTIRLVAVVVLLGAVIAVYAFGLVSDLREPAPTIAQSSGDFTPQDGNKGGIVLLTHESGDTVRTADLEIAVQAECDAGTKRGRILNLPAGAENAVRESDGQITGDNIFDERSLNTIDNAVARIDDGGALLKPRYATGDTVLFRIPRSKCVLAPGSEVSVRVVHTPSQSVIVEERLNA